MDDAIEVTVLRHEENGAHAEDRDFVTTSKLIFFTTTNYSVNNATRPDFRKFEVLFLYVLPVIIVIGTIGNVLSILVLIRCQMRNTSVYFYLLALAVADTCILYFSAFRTWIGLVVGYDIHHVSDGACKSIHFFVLVSWHLSAWLIVLITVDRFVVVWFPFKASYFCTVTRSHIATAVLLLVTVVYNSHVFWTYRLEYVDNLGRIVCKPPPNSTFFDDKGFELLKLTTYSLIPFAIILVLNAAIITRLLWRPALLRGRSSDTTSTFSGSSRTESSTRGRQVKVTYMLVAVSLAWLLLTLPYAIHTLLVYKNVPISSSQIMFRAISFLLMYTNHAINFYLYCITGKKFRRELEDLSRDACLRMTEGSNGGGGGGHGVGVGGSTVCSPSRKTYGARTNVVDIELHELVND